MTDPRNLVVYRFQCAAMVRGCMAAIAIDGPSGIDVCNLDPEVPEDRRIRDLLHAASWRLDRGYWVCGNHMMTPLVFTTAGAL